MKNLAIPSHHPYIKIMLRWLTSSFLGYLIPIVMLRGFGILLIVFLAPSIPGWLGRASKAADGRLVLPLRPFSRCLAGQCRQSNTRWKALDFLASEYLDEWHAWASELILVPIQTDKGRWGKRLISCIVGRIINSFVNFFFTYLDGDTALRPK